MVLRKWLAALVACGAVMMSTAVRADGPDVVIDEDNALLEDLLLLGLGTHNTALGLAFSPDPFIGIPAEVVAYVANIGLKRVPAMLIQPDNKTFDPNSADQCTYDFTMPQSSWKYVNYLGFIDSSPVPANWGELGAPFVAHANSDVVIRAVNRYVPLFDEPPRVGLFARQTPQSVGVSFPAGNHPVRWEAETLIDPIMDLLVPPVLLAASSELRYGSTGISAAGGALKTLSKQQIARKVILDFAIEAGLIVAEEGLDDLLDGKPTVAHHRLQTITVRDLVPPTLELGQTQFTFEATDFGGTLTERVWDESVAPTINAYDGCDRLPSLFDDAPVLLPIGTTEIEVTVSDPGPNADGESNRVSDSIFITVEDTQAPLIVAPPSRVVEIPASESGIDADTLMLGKPQVVDLADSSPTVSNDGPAFYPIDSRADVVWSAADDSGNTGTATQFITVKTEGTNTTPTVDDATATTLTSQPVDIVLTGADADFLDGQFDPISFAIDTPPANGEFVAPLLPYFIDDYRTNPEGPYGEEFLFANHSQWLFANVCQAATNPVADLPRGEIDRRWVYDPIYVKVTDAGEYFLLDYYWDCEINKADKEKRISKWTADGEFLGQKQFSGTYDHFVLDDDGAIYILPRNGTGTSTTFNIKQCRSDFENQNGTHCGRSWGFDFDSVPGIVPESLAYSRVNAEAGVLYLNDTRRVFAFDVRDTPYTEPGEAFSTYKPPYIGTLFDGERLIGAMDPGNCGGNPRSGYTMDIDSAGDLYVADTCDDRIHKFTATTIAADDAVTLGSYVGWLGYCETSPNKACDVDRQRSKGYSCTNETCGISGPQATRGTEPGQFGFIPHMVVDPNDILYVVDSSNSRIQRFGPDGTFAGEAVSTGTGVNQGDRPGFVLGNFGRPRTVSVNSKQFFVVDTEVDLVHVFETTPFKDITSNSATVTYVSEFDFHSSTDTFTYTATDGLATSATGVASVTVDRNFRRPIALSFDDLQIGEDDSLLIELQGDDPDGIAGVDFNGLDTLTYRIVREPRRGTLTGEQEILTYTPNPDFNGSDYFLFVTNDGLEDSEPGRIDIDVIAVDDPPVVTELGLPDTWGRGFPILLAGEFSDDGSAEFDTRVEWGDGVTSLKGGIVEDENGSRLVGVELIEPVTGIGTGQAIAEHTYAATGLETARLCVSDADARESCLDSVVDIKSLVMLTAGAVAPEESVPQGQAVTIAFAITNEQPEGWSGLPATNVRIRQLADSELDVVSLDGAPNGCGITSGRLDCLLAVMAPGQTTAFSLTARYTGPIFFDAFVDFSVEATNLTPAVVPSTLASTTVQFTADASDSDGDGMNDAWETAFGLDPSADDADIDADADGLTNAEEFANQTDPRNPDSDGDGYSDGAEVDAMTNPNVAADTDNDGIANDVDTDDDNDGMTDVYERGAGLDPLSSLDALADLDGDGVSNLAEAQAGTSPSDAGDVPAASTPAPTLFSSVLPLNRATVVDGTVSAFATIFNAGDAATGCGMVPRTPMAAEFSYWATDPATNAITGGLNEASSIAAGTSQSFVFAFTPREELDSVVEFRFACDGVDAANTITGVNTFVLQANRNPTADLIALAATTSNDGIVALAGGVGAFSVASVNVGAPDWMAVRARVPEGLPVSVVLCQTDPATAACINPGVPAEAASAFFDSSSTPTFSVFPAASGPVAFDPAVSRVFVEFVDPMGVVRGSTSVAIRND